MTEDLDLDEGMITALRAAAALDFPTELPPLRRPEPLHDPFATRGRRAAPRRARLVAGLAAAVVVLAGGGFAIGRATSPDHVVTVPKATATVALQPVGATTVEGQASMIGTGEDQRMRIRLSGLPSPGAGKFYAVRLIPKSGQPLTVGLLVDGQGDFALPARLVPGFVAIDIDVVSGQQSESLARGSLG